MPTGDFLLKLVKIPKKYCWNEKCILTKYLPVSVDPDRCWLPYCTGAPVLPFLTCEKRDTGVREETKRGKKAEKKADGRGEVKGGHRK